VKAVSTYSPAGSVGGVAVSPAPNAITTVQTGVPSDCTGTAFSSSGPR